MKKLLFFVVFVLSVFCGRNANGQPPIQYWDFDDSTNFTFGVNDSLSRTFPLWSQSRLVSIDTSHTDSTNTQLWQIGNTNKPFFADSGIVRGIMTDTIHEYPVNANSWFVIKGFSDFYYSLTIFSFWHKYQTSAGHDGGIVEYSIDTGHTWNNILKYACLDSNNFYGVNDTLTSGEPAFSGTSNGWVRSQFEILSNPDLCAAYSNVFDFQVRFRFKSDSIPDTLDGWAISNISVRIDVEEGISKINKATTLNIYPNPSNDALFNFPAMDEEKEYSIEVMDAMGRRVLRMPYVHEINLSAYAKGIYFFRVSNGVENYSGKLVTD